MMAAVQAGSSSSGSGPEALGAFGPQRLKSHPSRVAMPSSLNATPRHVPTLATKQPMQGQRPPSEGSKTPTPPGSRDEEAGPSTQAGAPDPQHAARRDTVTAPSETQQQPARKKKAASVLGFFTLREPTTLALEEFAEHQKALAAQKGLKSPARSSVLSSQKLPEHVPKVNSKWNGLPEPAPKASVDGKNKKRSELQTRSSTSRSSQSSDQSSKRPIGSLSSKPSSSRRSRDERHPAASTTRAGHERTDSQTHYANIAPPTATHPAFRAPTHSNDPRPSQTFLDPPSPTAHLKLPSDPLFTPEDEVFEMPCLQKPSTSSERSTSREASPLTPSLEDTMTLSKLSGSVIVPHNISHGHKDSWDRGTFWISSDSEDVIVKSAGHDVLGPPVTINRNPSLRSAMAKPKNDALEASTEFVVEGPPPLPSPAETKSSVVSRPEPNPNLVRNFSHISKYHSRANSMSSAYSRSASSATPSVDPNQSTASSVASGTAPPPKVVPDVIVEQQEPPEVGAPLTASPSMTSIVSAQWKMSPKERLSLGAKVTKGDVLPWEAFDPPTSAGAGGRTSFSSDNRRSRRLSQRLGLR